MSAVFDLFTSLKTKLGALVGVSVVVAVLLTLLGSAAGVPAWLVLPVAVALALGVTQLLAAGMTSPLRQMTAVAQQMARGDYRGRVRTATNDEVGRLAEAFNQMARDLSAVDAERRDLIATVSHELRTPLTAMTATLENLADGVVAADERHLRQALVQAEDLRVLVADLLELSRLEAGVVDLQHERLQLRLLVERAVDAVGVAGRGARFDVGIDPALRVDADPHRLGQLLRNVLDNAGRLSPPEDAVVVTAGTSDSGWWLEVRDRGPGVAPADRERVFERFGTTGGGGTGVGLAVSRWVARLHGGTLQFVDPPDGTGARLRLDLPVSGARTTEQETRVGDAVESPAESPAPAPAPAPEPPPRPVMDGLFGGFWPELDRSPGTRTVLATAAAAVFAGAVMSFTRPGVSWTLLLLAAGAAALVTARRRRQPWTVLCSLLAFLLVLPFTLLGSWGMGMLGMLTAAAVFLCGLTGARSALGIVLTGISWPLASLRGLPWFGRSLRISGRPGGTPAVLRTVIWSLLAALVFGALFASADALFATWVDRLVPSLSFGAFVGRAFVACGVFGLTLAAAYLGVNPARVDLTSDRSPSPWATRYEWLVPVLVIDSVFALFIAAQAAAFFGGHDYVERTTGLTYADYVHQGFGQLTVATALTLLVVGVVSRRVPHTPGERTWLFVALGSLCTLTLVVVASALHRMSLYQDAYGFTTLRLVVDVFEGWLGFLVLSVMALGAWGRGRWVPRVAVVSGAVAVLGIAALNPAAWVADQNLDRYEATGKLDAYYLGGLGADAIPTIIDRLPPQEAACVLALARHNDLAPEVLADVRAWNLARWRGDRALSRADLPQLEPDQADCHGRFVD